MESSKAASNAIDLRSLTVRTSLGQRLQQHVEFLASRDLMGRKPGTPGNRAAAAYLMERFRQLDLEPLPSLQGYGQTITPEVGDNLIGLRRPSGSESGGSILIGAHYDHLGGRYLGADDNASAVAILLETARLLPPLSRHAVLFVAFNAEEPPYIRTPLMGSQHFVDHLPAEIGNPSRFHAVLIMDLMGGAHWTPLRDTVFAAGAESSPLLYQRLKQSFGVRGEALGVSGTAGSDLPRFASDASPLTVLPLGMHLVEEIPLIGRVSFSDYDAFRNASVPYLFLSAGRTPRYHQPSDLADTLHYERMAATVQWLIALLRLLDQDTAPYRFEADRLELTDEIAVFRPLVAYAAQWKSRIPGTSPVSLARMKLDDRWLQNLDAAAATPTDIKRLERLSIRMQCLLADFYGCMFL